ncbi:hypothetical protein NV379_14715 [Paenibacillus sp. N1-5-1-14]|nr:hypothetical protein [Paenibacillus radicibacter]MCR8643905.1 hypothetical protein [Paenibacillus radicibacter]
MSKARKVAMKSKPKNEVNKKAIIWASSIFVALVVIMVVLLIINP